MSRARFFAVVALIASCAVLLHAQQESAYRAQLHTVPIYATVVDATGRLISGLAKKDFEVFDNGKRQPITLFANEPQPITAVVLLDRSGSMSGNFARVRDAAEEFIKNLTSRDRIRLGSFAEHVQIDPVEFTGDKSELVRILDEELQESGPTPLWNATAVGMSALSSQTGRRVVLLFTDGRDNPGAGPNVSLDEIRTRAVAEDVMLYAVGLADRCDTSTSQSSSQTDALFQRRVPRGTPGGRPPLLPAHPRGRGRVPVPIPLGPGRQPRPVPGSGLSGLLNASGCADAKPDKGLKELAADVGGAYFELKDSDRLPATFTRVVDELHHQYALAFTAATLDGKTHKLEVKVRQAGVTVRARKAYVSPTGK